MRRVQVLLEDWHYQYLRNLAERKKTAISAELRELSLKMHHKHYQIAIRFFKLLELLRK